ncbi:MAG: hypothetical protein WC680_11090 [Sulfuricurvum sp.]
MFASIRSTLFGEFYCRVKKEPVIQTSSYNVYELVDSMFPNDIVKKSKTRGNTIFRHVAIDNKGAGYLFDIDSKKLDLNMGLCDYIEDIK